jgi:methyl-accepting chemotaxis protein
MKTIVARGARHHNTFQIADSMKKPMTVARQLTLAFGLLLLFTVAVSALAWHSLNTTSVRAKSMYDDRVVPLALLNDVSKLAIRDRELVLEMLRSKDSGTILALAKQVDDDRSASEQAWKEYAATYLTPEEASLVAQYEGKEKAYVKDGLLAATKQLNAGNVEAAEALVAGSIGPAGAAFDKLLNELVALQRRVAAEDHSAIERSAALFSTLMVVAVALSLLTGSLAAYFIIKRLTRTLGAEPDALSAIARAIAAGDLTAHDPAPAGVTGVFGSMVQMRNSLAALVGEVRGGVTTVTNTSAQLANSSLELSGRTEEQAASLEETAASLEQMTSTITAGAEQAKNAHNLATQATALSQTGAKAVESVVQKMDEINDQSRRIAEITTVIDGLAFQTNLLALNAAVEAARAGEQGRGFAVVAAEVRSLAQRSAQAAKDIKSLIAASSSSVAEGKQRVADANQAMHDIDAQVKDVAELLDAIRRAASEQSAGIDQINSAVLLIDQATQANASLVEESAAASEALKDQAIQLAQSVSSFQTE